MNVAKTCVCCGTERVHAYDPADRRFECSVCGVRSWPAVDDPHLAAGTAPTLIPVEDAADPTTRAGLLSMVRGMFRAAEEAERRTGPMREDVAPMPVLTEEKDR